MTCSGLRSCTRVEIFSENDETWTSSCWILAEMELCGVTKIFLGLIMKSSASC